MRSYNDSNKWSTKLIDFTTNSLADIDPRSNTIVEIEIGSDIYSAMNRDGVINTEVGRVVAENSALGYLFS